MRLILKLEEHLLGFFSFEGSRVLEVRVFLYPNQKSVLNFVVHVCYQEKWPEDGMGVALAQAALDRYRRYDTDMLTSSVTKQALLVVSLKAIDGAGAEPGGVGSGKKTYPTLSL